MIRVWAVALCLAAVSAIEVPCVHPAEYEALESVYLATKGQSWFRQQNWQNRNVPMDDWHGISCRKGLVSSIELSGNNIDGPVLSLHGLKSLSYLDLSWNRISAVNFTGMHALSTVSLSANPLRFSFTALPSLLELDLSAVLLIQLPTNAAQLMPKLESLSLAWNSLAQLPSLAAFGSLNYLDCSNNRLRRLPPLPPALFTLKASNNLLSDVAACVGLPDLEYLEVAHNPKIDLSALALLPSLTVLDLKFCGLDAFPPLANLTGCATRCVECFSWRSSLFAWISQAADS